LVFLLAQIHPHILKKGLGQQSTLGGFGGTTTSTNPFGQPQQATGLAGAAPAFSFSNTPGNAFGGGLLGQNKPLLGGTITTANPFGTTPTATGFNQPLGMTTPQPGGLFSPGLGMGGAGGTTTTMMGQGGVVVGVSPGETRYADLPEATKQLLVHVYYRRYLHQQQLSQIK